MTEKENAIKALEAVKELQRDIDKFKPNKSLANSSKAFVIDREDILRALVKISPNLGNSYIQVKQDLKDHSRISWAGTAHEIREIVSNLLRILAPDKEVVTQTWFVIESKDGRPTHKQRAKYILQTKGMNSSQKEAAGKVEMLDEMIAELVRSIYTRGSVAAHTYEDRIEVIKILGYFEAFAHDLLDLK